MDFFSLFGHPRPRKSRKKKKAQPVLKQVPVRRPDIEALEDRMVLSGNVISGHIYNDANANGIMDAGEDPIANSNLELRNDQGQVIATTTSDANGFYEFTHDNTIDTNLMVEEQTIAIPATAGSFTLTEAFNQFDPTKGELLEVEIIHEGSITSQIKAEHESPLAGATINGVVGGKFSLTGQGFSIDSTVSENIGSFNATVYDNNTDFGGSSGVTFPEMTATADAKSITLTGNEVNPFIGTGTVIVTEKVEATSSAKGGGNLTVKITSSGMATIRVRYRYRPQNCLMPGDYTIHQTEQPQGFLDGSESRGTSVIPNSVGTDSISVTLTDLADARNNNFGEIRAASLAGHVYYDMDGDGLKDAGEMGIANVPITLTGTDDQGQAVNLTATTGSDGAYNFENLRPGTYTLNEQQPSGFLDGKDTIGTPGGSTSDDQFSNINLPAGFNGVNNNFGEVKSSSLSGFVYNDVDDDGLKEASEGGIGNVTINLTGTDDRGQSVSLTTQTASNGFYLFENLRPGTYTISETQPASFDDGKDTIGTPGGTRSNDQFSNINLMSDVHGENNNFGEILTNGVSGFVYHDANNNGIKDNGEQGIPGTTIILTGDSVSGPIAQQMQTDQNGFYRFPNLPQGTYSLTEIQPVGFEDGQESLGSAGGTAGNDFFENIFLANGTLGANYNFGELLSSSLSGFVYNDVNNNGFKDTGEVGIANTTVRLTGTDINSNPVNRTTTTAADGSYHFTGLFAGTYTIEETQPTGFIDGKDRIGTPGGTTNNDQFTDIFLPDGFAGANNNFGEVQSSGLSGFVYEDLSNDGIKDAGESGIAEVTIELEGTSDIDGSTITRTTTTDANGFYRFADLPPGTYVIRETQPAAFLDGQDTIGTQGGTTENDVFSNIVLPPNVLGTDNNFGEIVGIVSPPTDVEIIKTADPNSMPVGSIFTYTLTINNLTRENALGVTVVDSLPPGVTFISASHSSDWTFTQLGTTLMFNRTTPLLGLTSSTITITAIAPNVAGTFTNVATVNALEETDFSNNQDDAVITTFTTISPPPTTPPPTTPPTVPPPIPPGLSKANILSSAMFWQSLM